MWLIVWLIARTPLPLAAALSWILSWLWWTVVPVRRRMGAATLVLATHLGSWDLIGGLLVSRTGARRGQSAASPSGSSSHSHCHPNQRWLSPAPCSGSSSGRRSLLDGSI